MTKKSIIIFAAAAVLSAIAIVYGWIFVDSRIGEATLTEETIFGDRAAADGLTVGFRADSADNIHWINSFDYSTGRTKTDFKRGEMAQKIDTLVYDDIRFAGWSTEPYFTRLTYSGLAGLQDKELQKFYDQIQQRVIESGEEETGKVRLKDKLDYYPVSFSFQFGTKVYDSANALTGLKIYEESGAISEESGTAYDDDVYLYTTFNNFFKIPVIDNEYQEYKVSKVDGYNYKKELGFKTEVAKPLGEGEDYYEFDPIIVLQEENVQDGNKWVHPDLAGGETYEAGEDESYEGKTAASYNLKNRLLFAVNNRTAKGEPVDVSRIQGGYGIYELPFIVVANQTISKSPRSYTGAHPEPVMEQMQMVYPLDHEAEYVEMSLSGDHRYIAVFSVKDGAYFVDVVDADLWTSPGPVELFPASEKMAYAWGDDGSLAVTNHQGYIAVLERTEDDTAPYQILYSGKVEAGMDKAFFDTDMIEKENSIAGHGYTVDRGLAVTVKDGKAALVQNLLVSGGDLNIRNAALECAVIDRSGVIYRGVLKSDIVDLEYDMDKDEAEAVKAVLDGAAKGSALSKVAKAMITPVRNETWARW